ncbi:hypothetical protein ACVTT1_001261 [Vibrio cholerae]
MSDKKFKYFRLEGKVRGHYVDPNEYENNKAQHYLGECKRISSDFDQLVEENKQLQEALEQAKAMSIESINREDLVILISTGFRHAEIKGSFEIDDLYAAFDSMVYKRKKLLSEIGGE